MKETIFVPVAGRSQKTVQASQVNRYQFDTKKSCSEYILSAAIWLFLLAMVAGAIIYFVA